MTRSPVCFARAMPLSSGRSALLPMTEASPVPRRPRPLLTLSILLLGICFAAAACGPPGDPSPDPPSNADSPDTGTPDAGTPDAPWLALSVQTERLAENPLLDLRRQYDEWRRTVDPDPVVFDGR